MADCIQLQAQIEVCEQELDALQDQVMDKEIECMDLWLIYWMECEHAPASADDGLDLNSTSARKARRLVDGLRTMGYELNRVKD